MSSSPVETQAVYKPFFQPILSVEDQSTYGFEILAREKTGEDYLLPTIFKNSFLDSKNHDTLIHNLLGEIENQVLNSAFQDYQQTGNGFLFINRSPDQLIRDLESSKGLDLSILQLIKKFQIPASKIYIEVTEQSSLRDLDSIAFAIEFYRDLGFRIAMDDVGTQSSNLERIGLLQPDIIKVDLNLLKRSITSRGFQSVLEYLREVALGIGADLLFEGIETSEELSRAVDSGARFLQGFLLGIPDKKMSSGILESNLLTSHLNIFHENKRSIIYNEIEFEESIRRLLQGQSIRLVPSGKTINLDPRQIFQLSPYIQRIYATDWEGTQVTPYYEKSGDNSFIQNTNTVLKNWSYMPYFYKHIRQVFRNPTFWNSSDAYYDKKLNSRILVFSKVLEEQYSVFIDVSLP